MVPHVEASSGERLELSLQIFEVSHWQQRIFSSLKPPILPHTATFASETDLADPYVESLSLATASLCFIKATGATTLEPQI